MNVLVTGANGAVAQYVIADLAREHDLVLCSRRHPSEAGHATPKDAVDLSVSLV